MYRFVVSRTSGQIILRGRLYLPLLLERPGSSKRAGPSCDAAKLCLSSNNVSGTPQQPTASHALRSLPPNPPPPLIHAEPSQAERSAGPACLPGRRLHAGVAADLRRPPARRRGWVAPKRAGPPTLVLGGWCSAPDRFWRRGGVGVRHAVTGDSLASDTHLPNWDTLLEVILSRNQ